MILDAQTKKLEILLGGAVTANQLPFVCAWSDIGASAATPGGNDGATNGATPVDLVLVPGASTQRFVKNILVHNDDTAVATVTIRYNNNGTTRKVISVGLDPGDTLEWMNGWKVMDSSGRVKTVIGTTGSVPIGGIIMWSGSIASIPADWALCDGTGGTPDLRDKFVVGAKQDDAGTAKTNLEGALSQTGGTTAHIHSSHAGLTHAGLTIGDHTGLTHALAIANHPDLTHVAIGDHSVASQAVTMPGLTHGDHSVASGTISVAAPADHPSATYAHASHPAATYTHQSIASRASQSGTPRSLQTGTASRISITHVEGNIASFPAYTTPNHSNPEGTHNALSIVAGTHATIVGTVPAATLAHASHPTFTGSSPAATLTHAAVGTHAGTTYGVHTITQPADHGAAGTVTHAYSQPNDHAISAHDTVGNVIPYFALAFIQRVA